MIRYVISDNTSLHTSPNTVVDYKLTDLAESDIIKINRHLNHQEYTDSSRGSSLESNRESSSTDHVEDFNFTIKQKPEVITKARIPGFSNKGLGLETNKDIPQFKPKILGKCKSGLKRRLPEAIIIGSRKAGTRAVLEYIALHPDVVVPGREILFFNVHYHKGLEFYKSQMPCSKDGQLTLEKTPAYILDDETPERIYHMNKDIKLILVVRDPVHRTISDYVQFKVRDHIEQVANRSFELMSFLSHTYEPNVTFDPVKWSIYYRYFSNYLQYFSLNQMHILDGDILTKNPFKEIHSLEKFLGLNSKIQEHNFYLNKTRGFYCYKNINGLNHCFRAEKGRPHPDVPQRYMKELYRFFEPLNEKFFAQIGRRFDWNYHDPLTDYHVKELPREDFAVQTYQRPPVKPENSIDNCPVRTRQLLPTVIILGSDQLGTKLLSRILNLHPVVYSVKEQLFYLDTGYNITMGTEGYRRQMPCTPMYTVTVDWSSTYMFNLDLPEQIFRINPQIEILFVLRDPIKRFVNEYPELVHLYNNSKQANLMEELYENNNKARNAIDQSRYYNYLLQWYIWFRKNQIHIIYEDQLLRDPYEAALKATEHLKLAPLIKNNTEFHQTVAEVIYSEEQLESKIYAVPYKRYNLNLVKALYQYFYSWNVLLYLLTQEFIQWTFKCFM